MPPHHGVRRLRRRHLLARSSASTTTSPSRPRTSRASACGASSPSAALLAAGAIERPLVFGDNDRPGIMLAGAVRTYLNRYAVAPGRRAVVFGTSDEAARTVADLARAGVQVAAVVDPRSSVPGSIEAAAKSAGARLIAGGAVVRARGSLRVRAVDVRTAAGETLRIGCDLVCVSGGWSPDAASHLASGRAARLGRDHRGVRPRPAAEGHDAWRAPPAASSTSPMPCGRALRCGLEAASDCGFSGQPLDLPEVEPESVVAGAALARRAARAARRSSTSRTTCPTRTWRWRGTRASAPSSS